MMTERFEILEFAVIGPLPTCKNCDEIAKWIVNRHMLCNECFWKIREG